MTQLSSRRPYVPEPIALNLLIASGLLAVGWGIYYRYVVIEYPNIGLACEGGLATLGCKVRDIVIGLFNHGFFGYLALGAAVLSLLRPQSFLIWVALVAGGTGLPLYNTGAASLAIALAVLSLARRVRATGPETD